MNNAITYPFRAATTTLGEASLSPLLPLKFMAWQQTVEALGLLDTGASVNVLPYELGLKLGLKLENYPQTVRLTGNLAQYEAHVVMQSIVVGELPAVDLVWAWTQAPQVPLILGQVNFFMEFDVCFYRSQQKFSIQPKTK